MAYRIHLKKILWIYLLAFILTAFSFHSKAETHSVPAPAKKMSASNLVSFNEPSSRRL